MSADARRTAARAFFALIALVVLLGIIVQFHATWGIESGYFKTRPGRLVNMFCFFTVQSNILVMITTALLAIRPERTSTVFRSVWLSALIAITVTGIVFHIALSDLHDLDGGAALANFLLHTASPVLSVVGWLAFGPRRLIDRPAILGSTVYPLLWSVFVLIRGPIYGYYPYPFIDVIKIGYARAILSIFVVAILFLALAFGAWWLDSRLARLVPTSIDGRAESRPTPAVPA